MFEVSACHWLKSLKHPFSLALEGKFNGYWNQELNYTGQLDMTGLSYSKKNLAYNQESKTEDNFLLNYQSSLDSLEGAVPANQRWTELFSFVAEKILELPANAAEVAIIPKDFDARNTWRKIQKSISGKIFCGLEDLDISKFYTKNASLDEIEKYLDHIMLIQSRSTEKENQSHPLTLLKIALQTVFEKSYTGIGKHRELLPSALKEFTSFNIRYFNILKWIFPQISQNVTAESMLNFSAGKLVTPRLLPVPELEFANLS